MRATEIELFIWWDQVERLWKANTWSRVVSRWGAGDLSTLVGKLERWYARLEDQGNDQRRADDEDQSLLVF